MVFFGIAMIFLWRPELYCLGQILDDQYDKDIGGALIAISRKTSRNCPTVLIYDERMPELSSLQNFIQRMQEHGRQFISLDLSEDNLPKLQLRYGTSNRPEILQHFLHLLYRQHRCYTFQVWVKDPRILYPETESNTMYHPGWRWSDHVILVAHHYTKRYKSLINLRFWALIPNIVGLKRNNFDVRGIVKVFTVLPYFLNGKRKSHEIDTWNDTKREFVRNSSRIFFDKFTDFHNSSVGLGVLWKEPFFIWGNKDNPYLDGLDLRLILLCQRILKFSLRFKNTNITGRKINNNSWSGLIGDLAEGSIDVGVGGISVTSERLKFFDFCRTYYTDSFNFISPHKDGSNSAFGNLFSPLSDEVWLATFLSAMCGIITLKFVASFKYRMASSRYNKMDPRDKYFTSFGNICGFVGTVMCQKPYRHIPKALAVQFVYYGLSLTMFCLGIVFSSCFISFILSFKPEPVADKIEDILKTGLPVAIKNYDGHLNAYMMESGSPMLTKIYEKAVLVDYYQGFDAIDDVVKGKKIYIDSKANIYFNARYRYSGSKGLKLHISSESIIEFANLGWPVQKNWPFAKKFDDIISRAVESGLVQHWVTYFMDGNFGGGSESYRIPDNLLMEMKLVAEEDPSVNVKGEFAPLSINNITGIIRFLVVGIFLSIFVFIGECTYKFIGTISKMIMLRCYKIWKSDTFVDQTEGQINRNCFDNSLKIQKSVKKHGKKLSKTKKSKLKPISNQRLISDYPQLIWNDFGTQFSSRREQLRKLE